MIVRLANLHDSGDQRAILELLDMYARDPFGEGQPLAPEVRERLIPGLQRQPQGRIFLAWQRDQPVGLAVCFLGFSSFRALPLLNVHDLAVVPGHRGRGIGRALLEAAEAEARRCGCCRLTLEVRVDNTRAQDLYERFGFAAGDPQSDAHWFWKKSLE